MSRTAKQKQQAINTCLKRRYVTDPAYKQRKKDHALARRRAYQHWIDSLKATVGCTRCPEKDPACLDYHHRDAKEKSFAIANAVNRKFNKQRILDEIAKCDVLCANCHRKQHRRY